MDIPVFSGHECKNLLDTVGLTFVSSVGAPIDRFERDVAAYIRNPWAVTSSSGTAALHIGMHFAENREATDLAMTHLMTCKIEETATGKQYENFVTRKLYGERRIFPNHLKTQENVLQK